MTRVFGVTGHPIDHSLSPRMHQAACDALRLDAVYAPFDVPPADAGPVLRGLIATGVSGLNVTVPLKEVMVRHVDRLTGDAAALRAVNTVVIRNGRAIGHNTDVIGIARALRELGWPACRDARGAGRRGRPCAALILGAGGAAKAVAWALSSVRGTQITLANRHPKRAQQAAAWLRRARKGCHVTVQPLRGLDARPYRLIINATSVGMQGDARLVNPRHLTRGQLVYDLVYNRPTRLVREARRRGCVAAGGVSMLVYQGAAAFELWWHRPAPVAVMRRAVEEALCRA